ncbi:hypothetical protein ACRRTK_003668 [Alexandromys fortis]
MGPFVVCYQLYFYDKISMLYFTLISLTISNLNVDYHFGPSRRKTKQKLIFISRFTEGVKHEYRAI